MCAFRISKSHRQLSAQALMAATQGWALLTVWISLFIITPLVAYYIKWQSTSQKILRQDSKLLILK
ncbi:MAG: hypothetical protein ACI910_001988 [Oleispira sp.]|jgi:hypothetical protein